MINKEMSEQQKASANKTENAYERREKPIDALFRLTKEISKETNAHIKEKYGVTHNLVDDRGMLSMDFFSRENGGIYTPEEIESDKQNILEKEIEWSGAEDPRVQEFYKTQKKVEGKEEIAREWMKNKEKEKSSQMEMLTNLILYKTLREKFIVARASRHDDLGGIDSYLVDTDTGDPVCVIDEVHDHERVGRKDEKWERVESIGKGGKTMKYCVVPEGDKLVQKEIKNIPVFFVSLTTEEIVRGMEGFSRNLDNTPNELESDYFNKFTILLQEEYDRVKDMQMPRVTKENLEKFRCALQTMKNIGEKQRTK